MVCRRSQVSGIGGLVRNGRLLLLLLLLPSIHGAGRSLGDAPPVVSRWEATIQKFEEDDLKKMPSTGAVLFVGSSSIRLWDTKKYFAEFPIVNRGFGGSQISDVLQFFDRIVTKYRPSTVVFYAGDNDFAAGRAVEQVVEDFQVFLGRVATQLPETRVVYLPVKPSLSRWNLWPSMREANRRIKALCETEDRWHYADTATPMLNRNGEPRPELFAKDGLHLSETGYELWSDVVRELLHQILPGAKRGPTAASSEGSSDASDASDRATDASPRNDWAESLRFYASFDDGVDADFARGDRRAYTATDISRKEVRPGLHVPHAKLVDSGKWGGALQFGPRTEETLFFQGTENLPYAENGFEGTISLWMKLSPDKDLDPGFVDPLQITDKAWNNACLFLDFSKDERPRHFRLGVFSDYAFWNPSDRGWDDIPEAERPMVTVKQPPFARDRWTHVAFTYRGFNSEEEAVATLYLDGRPVGSLTGPQKFTWNPNDVVMMLGIYYTGLLDELSVFDRAFSPEEIQQLAERTDSLKSLVFLSPAGRETWSVGSQHWVSWQGVHAASPSETKDVWYSADGVNWYELPNTPWKPRHAASVFVHDGSLWMVAGNNMESDVWRLTTSDDQ